MYKICIRWRRISMAFFHPPWKSRFVLSSCLFQCPRPDRSASSTMWLVIQPKAGDAPVRESFDMFLTYSYNIYIYIVGNWLDQLPEKYKKDQKHTSPYESICRFQKERHWHYPRLRFGVVRGKWYETFKQDTPVNCHDFSSAICANLQDPAKRYGTT